jgi:hypothetical protein
MTFLSAILSLIQWATKLFSREGRGQHVKLVTPWKGDRPIESLIPTQGDTNRINADIVYTSSGIRTQVPSDPRVSTVHWLVLSDLRFSLWWLWNVTP